METDEEINFGGEGESTWTYTSDLRWYRHTSRRLTQAERTPAPGKLPRRAESAGVETTIHLHY